MKAKEAALLAAKCLTPTSELMKPFLTQIFAKVKLCAERGLFEVEVSLPLSGNNWSEHVQKAVRQILSTEYGYKIEDLKRQGSCHGFGGDTYHSIQNYWKISWYAQED